MANWKSVLDISEEYRAFDDDGDIVKLRESVVNRLRSNVYKDGLEHRGIIDAFEFAENVEDFDHAMFELYNFADVGHRIWVKTF